MQAVASTQRPFFMMKRHILLFISLIWASVSVAQTTEHLVINELNKYTYLQVQTVKQSIDLPELAQYLKKNATGVKSAVPGNTGITGTGQILIYKKGLLTSQEQAAITYDLSIDVKDNKYRLLLTNMVYTPYQRNRYGVFAPADGAGTNLEKMKSKLAVKQFNDLLNTVSAYGAKLERIVNGQVHNILLHKAKADTLKRVNTRNW